MHSYLLSKTLLQDIFHLLFSTGVYPRGKEPKFSIGAYVYYGDFSVLSDEERVCRKTQTKKKVITPTNHKGHRWTNEN